MKVLVLSSSPWAESNSFGSTYSNIFGGIEGLELANIYCKPGTPDNGIVLRYFQLTELSLIRNLLNRAVPPGRSFDSSDVRCRDDLSSGASVTRQELPAYRFARARRLQVFFWARDLIWRIGRWRSDELKAFIDDFAPDVLFQPIYHSSYLSDIALFIQKRADAPMVGYVSDDVYTLCQFSLSPLYWIDRLLKRRKVRRVIDRCELLFVVSDVQKFEYERLFKPRCEVLTKCSDFDTQPPFVNVVADREHNRRPLKLLYAGNIGAGRWRTLGLLVAAIGRVNDGGGRLHLTIHTATPITRAMRRALDAPGSSELMESVSSTEVINLQRAADVLVHVEGFDLRSRLQVRQSFSTKLVDCFASGRCVLAVGPEDVASIEYLRRNDAALVASSPKQLDQLLLDIFTKEGMIEEYALKGWATGRRNHNRSDVQRRLVSELESVMSASGQNQ